MSDSEVLESEADVSTIGEVEQLEDEVRLLQTDQAYNDFIDHIVSGRIIADDTTDSDFVVDDTSQPIMSTTEEDDEVRQADESDGNEYPSSSTSSPSSSDDEAEEDIDNVPNALGDVVIPRDALIDASKRFEPFWRTKNQLARMGHESYDSNDDEDFVQAEAAMDAKLLAYRDGDNEVDMDTDGSSDSSISSSDYDDNMDDESFVQQAGDGVLPALDQIKIYDESEIAAQPIGQDFVQAGGAVDQVEPLAKAIISQEDEPYQSDEDPTFDVNNIGHASGSGEEDSDADSCSSYSSADSSLSPDDVTTTPIVTTRSVKRIDSAVPDSGIQGDNKENVGNTASAH